MLAKLHGVIDQTTDRMKSRRIRLKNILEEEADDIHIHIEVMKEIEEMQISIEGETA